MLAKGRRENMKLRDVYNLMAAARGHWGFRIVCGSKSCGAETPPWRLRPPPRLVVSRKGKLN
jgi:hypothetical protein